MRTRTHLRTLFLLAFAGALFAWRPLQTPAHATEHLGGEELIVARVVEIIEQREITREDGARSLQQNLRLRGLRGEWRGREIITEGVSDLEVIAAHAYRVGDRVIVQRVPGVDGADQFFAVDYVRTRGLLLLALGFAALVVAVGRMKGLRALVSLAVSFLVIMRFIIPRILAGDNPLWVSIIGALMILVTLTYLTEGFKRQSHVAIVAMLVSLVLTYVLATAATALAKITGLAQEEVMYLVGVGKGAINFHGLLLAAMLIGTLGVLDDTVISQVETVEQIRLANPRLPPRELFARAFKVGNAHLGAVINTLFLAYAGASLPLLLLFVVQQPPFLSAGQVINSEMVATEIVKTLVGSSGLAFSMPIATSLAVYLPRRNAPPERRLPG